MTAYAPRHAPVQPRQPRRHPLLRRVRTAALWLPARFVRTEYAGPPLFEVRPDGLVHVDGGEPVVLPAWLRETPVVARTGQIPAVPSTEEMRDQYFSRADHDEIDREFTDRPGLALLARVRDGLRRAA